jgi:hypothetical protein
VEGPPPGVILLRPWTDPALRRIAVVDLPGRNRIVLTVPPRDRTKPAPTISLPFQSPPFTRTSGATSSMRVSGVSCGKTTTRETQEREARR